MKMSTSKIRALQKVQMCIYIEGALVMHKRPVKKILEKIGSDEETNNE